MLLGVLFIVLGVMAIAEPMVAGLAVAVLVGWLLILGGLLHLASAFTGGGLRRVVWQATSGVIYLIGGIYFLAHPLVGLGSLTLFFAGILLAEAILESAAYTRTRNEAGAGWRIVNVVVTLILAAMIWSQWPSSAVWAIGTLAGVNLIMTGSAQLMIASAARQLRAGLGA